MSDQIFLLSDQNGALVGHMSFQGKKNYLQPCCRILLRKLLKNKHYPVKVQLINFNLNGHTLGSIHRLKS